MALEKLKKFVLCTKDEDSDQTKLTENSINNEEKNDSQRDSWGHKAEFLLTSIGCAVGLGNIWRFPYLCQKNGGGAFLIPYFTMMIIEGIPLFYIEYAIGQRFKKSAVGAWSSVHPALMGVGISCLVLSFLLSVYYICVIAWCFYYLFVSLAKSLPWSIENCPGYTQYKNISDACSKNSTLDCTRMGNFSDCCVHDPPLYYFYRSVLNVSTSIEDTGDGVQWKLIGCLCVAWVIVYGSIMKGVKSTGKVAYFTATFPYVILLILLIFGLTLEGATDGLVTLFKPDFSRIADPKIWLDAAVQMFFTLSLGFGALISFASYLPIKNNCVRDAYTVVVINCTTSILAAVVVFTILGFRQSQLAENAKKIGEGPGMVFITFCDAFLQMKVSPLWSVLFFIMLILLGISSEFGTLEGFVAPFYDMKWVKMRKEIFTGIIALVMLCIGVAIVSSPGFYIFQMFDDYSVSMGLIFVAFFQTVAVSWVYGTDRFANDIEFMTGKRPFFFWMLCWKYISPIAIFIIFVANCHELVTVGPMYSVYVGCKQQLVQFSPFGPGVDGSMKKIPYPAWSKFVISIFVILPILPILFTLVKHLIRHPWEWSNGFKTKLTNIYEYHPDPSAVDHTRRKTPQQIEYEILNETSL